MQKKEVRCYNERQVHPTTKEILLLRFERALREGQTQLKPFSLPSPFTSSKDIVEVPRAIPVGARVELDIIPDPARPEVRVWYANAVRQVVLLRKS